MLSACVRGSEARVPRPAIIFMREAPKHTPPRPLLDPIDTGIDTGETIDEQTSILSAGRDDHPLVQDLRGPSHAVPVIVARSAVGEGLRASLQRTDLSEACRQLNRQ